MRDLLAPNRPRLMIKPDSAYSIKTPLVPANSVAGRSLVMVIAIMTFLAALTAGPRRSFQTHQLTGGAKPQAKQVFNYAPRRGEI